MMKKFLKESKGITLISLSIAVIIILIIGTVIFFILNNKEEENRMQETNNQNHTQQTENSINGQGQDMAQAPVFDFETRTVTLNSGYEMPLNGIGTYSLTGDECYNSIISALNSGSSSFWGLPVFTSCLYTGGRAAG